MSSSSLTRSRIHKCIRFSYVIVDDVIHTQTSETMEADDIVSHRCRRSTLAAIASRHINLHIDVRPQLVQLRLRAVVQELVGIGHVVHVDADDRLHRRLRPPAERLAADAQRHPLIDDEPEHGTKANGHQDAEQQQA